MELDSKQGQDVSRMLDGIGLAPIKTSKKRQRAPTLPELNQRVYNLPRRFDVREMATHKTSLRQNLSKNEANMQILDSKISTLDDQTVHKLKKELQKGKILLHNHKAPLVQRKKPIRDSDMSLFKEIFVKPREEKLVVLKENTDIKDEESKKLEKILLMYEEKEMKKFRIFEEEKPDEALEKMREVTKKPDNYERYNKYQLKIRNQSKAKEGEHDLRRNLTKSAINQRSFHKKMLENISMSVIMNESTDGAPRNQSIEHYTGDPMLKENNKMIFNQQIQVEPPDFPNAHSGSPIAPGLGWAPSIPFIMDDEARLSLSDLLTRARAGMQAGEVQQEAHLSFYLALTYENKKMYKKAIKHLKRYFNSAKTLEDKIGMSFAMNRIGVNYHKIGNDEKSLSYHIKNIELSDFENVFAGLYNSGISARNLGKLVESQDYLKKALDWSISKNDLETECLVYGQIGITKSGMGDFENALSSLTKCKDMSRHIQNLRLNLDSLICISNIRHKMRTQTDTDSAETEKEIFKEALDYAINLGDKKYELSCIASLGILDGQIAFENFKNILSPESRAGPVLRASTTQLCAKTNNPVVEVDEENYD